MQPLQTINNDSTKLIIIKGYVMLDISKSAQF